MKKTLIILLTFAGVAAGAAPTPNPTVEGALVGITNFTGVGSTIDINATSDTITLVDSETKEGYLELSGTTFSTKGDKRTYITLSFVVDLAKLTTPEANAPFFTESSAGWGSVLKTDRTFTGAWSHTAWTGAGNYTTSALGTSGSAVLTFNTGWPGTGTETAGAQCPSQVYLDGELISGDKGYGLAFGNDITKIYINESFAGAIEGLYIHNSMIMGDDAKTLYNSITVPEPSTATLSLLALAGLAARRRRK